MCMTTRARARGPTTVQACKRLFGYTNEWTRWNSYTDFDILKFMHWPLIVRRIFCCCCSLCYHLICYCTNIQICFGCSGCCCYSLTFKSIFNAYAIIITRTWTFQLLLELHGISYFFFSFVVIIFSFRFNFNIYSRLSVIKFMHAFVLKKTLLNLEWWYENQTATHMLVSLSLLPTLFTAQSFI